MAQQLDEPLDPQVPQALVSATVALMQSYPELYADLGDLAGKPAIPREEFYDYLHAPMGAGLGTRLMFGSGLSAQEWPASIASSFEAVGESAAQRRRSATL